MRRALRITLALGLVISLMTVIGCSAEDPEAEEPQLTALIEPPLIGEAGVLRVGIDLAYPPFGGVDKDMEAGIDVDVASVMATELGLELEIVDVSIDEAAAALESGDVDLVFAVPFNEQYATTFRFAGAYVTGAPVVFSRDGVEVDAAMLSSMSIVGQQGSVAFWELEHEYGAGFVTAYPTLREAFDAVDAGEADAVAGDALVGAYIARDYESISFAHQLDTGVPIGVVVGGEAQELETEIRALLDTLRADGVIDTIRSKWVGDLPEIELPQ